MGNSRGSLSLNSILVSIVIFAVHTVHGQISTPCTTSLISSFTPCVNFITGSSRNGSSPTEECCNSLESLVSSSIDCACLIVTGNVPFSLPFTRNLAISLPSMCNSRVPIQCKASGVPLPAPGPVLFRPTLPPTSTPSPLASSPSPIASGPSPIASAPGPQSRVSKASIVAPSSDNTIPETTPVPPPVMASTPTTHSRIKPVVDPNPKSDSLPSYVITPTFLLIIIIIMLFDFY